MSRAPGASDTGGPAEAGPSSVEQEEGGGPAASHQRELDQIWRRLNLPQKEISSRYFYDTRGSELFVRITELPEYYPTRTERALLEHWGPRLIHRLQPAALLELGAGSARKTRVLLDAMEHRSTGGRYLPLDVSGDFLEDTARSLRREYPHLEVEPVVGDLLHPLDPELDVPRPVLLAFLGSTLGNFLERDAVGILRNVAAFLGPGDHFLLGVDLRPSELKPLEELEAAYNDSQGVTADFNRNALRVLNARFGLDFDVERFRHRAFYDAREGRIEMHLQAQASQTVAVPGKGRITFDAGETVRTEISCKYDRETVDHLFHQSNLHLVDWLPDDHRRYALVVGSVS